MAIDAIQMLKSVPLFADLSDREIADIAAHGKEVRFEPGRNIVTAGESGVGFHLILDGEATVDAGARSGKLGPGDYFGEMALLDRGPRSATITAATEVRTLSLISWDFLALLERSPSIATKLLVKLSQRLRAAEKDAVTH